MAESLLKSAANGAKEEYLFQQSDDNNTPIELAQKNEMRNIAMLAENLMVSSWSVIYTFIYTIVPEISVLKFSVFKSFCKFNFKNYYSNYSMYEPTFFGNNIIMSVFFNILTKISRTTAYVHIII